MQVVLHKNARTTPAIRRELQLSSKSKLDRELAQEYGLNRATVHKWRNRDNTNDASHCPHRLNTTLSPAQKIVVVHLRQTLLLSSDDLLAVTRGFINANVSHSGLDRCLRRHGVFNLKALMPKAEDSSKPLKKFKNYEPGFVHVDVKYLPQMPDETHRRYLFVAIDRASRWVYLELLDDKTATSASGFLNRLTAHAPFKIG